MTLTDYLWNKWDEEGIVPSVEVIEEEIELTEEEWMNIDTTVSNFLKRIRLEEGEVHYEFSYQRPKENPIRHTA